MFMLIYINILYMYLCIYTYIYDSRVWMYCMWTDSKSLTSNAWGVRWRNVYIAYTVHIGYTVHMGYTVYIVYTAYMVYIAFIVYNVHPVYIVTVLACF